jgi:hypothetical protein
MIGQIWMGLNASEVHWPAAIAYGKQKRMVQKRRWGGVRRHVSSFSLPCPRIVSPIAIVSQIPDHYARGQPPAGRAKGPESGPLLKKRSGMTDQTSLTRIRHLLAAN